MQSSLLEIKDPPNNHSPNVGKWQKKGDFLHNSCNCLDNSHNRDLQRLQHI